MSLQSYIFPNTTTGPLWGNTATNLGGTTLPNITQVRIGIAANSVVAGVMPNNLGTISVAASTVSPSITLFEP